MRFDFSMHLSIENLLARRGFSVWLSALPGKPAVCAPATLLRLLLPALPGAHILLVTEPTTCSVFLFFFCNSCGLYKSKDRVYLHLVALCAFACASLYLGCCVCNVFIRVCHVFNQASAFLTHSDSNRWAFFKRCF